VVNCGNCGRPRGADALEPDLCRRCSFASGAVCPWCDGLRASGSHEICVQNLEGVLLENSMWRTRVNELNAALATEREFSAKRERRIVEVVATADALSADLAAEQARRRRAELLATLSNRTLPVHDNLCEFRERIARLADHVQAGGPSPSTSAEIGGRLDMLVEIAALGWVSIARFMLSRMETDYGIG